MKDAKQIAKQLVKAINEDQRYACGGEGGGIWEDDTVYAFIASFITKAIEEDRASRQAVLSDAELEDLAVSFIRGEWPRDATFVRNDLPSIFKQAWRLCEKRMTSLPDDDTTSYVTTCCGLRFIGMNHSPEMNGVCRNCGGAFLKERVGAK